MDLANARLEEAKLKAVQASGDPAAKDIDGAAIPRRVQDSRVVLEQERNKVEQAKTNAAASRSSWVRCVTGSLPTSASASVARARPRTPRRT